jgi:hypothetical protein
MGFFYQATMRPGMGTPSRAHRASPSELKAQIEAQRRGEPFLVYRDGDGEQRIHALAGDAASVGREGTDVELGWDGEVSRVHAQLQRVAGDWAVVDDGLSRNGTFLNGDRLSGRRRLRDGDVLRFGRTTATFHLPAAGPGVETYVAPDAPDLAALSPTQRKVLVALCRPFKDGGAYASAATNKAIADELFLSVDAVKAHLRVLFEKFDVGDLPHNQKRLRLVELAFASGAVTTRDL